MDITQVLEKLALHTRHHVVSQQLLQAQPELVKQAFIFNDTKALQAQFSSEKQFAHETLVVQI